MMSHSCYECGNIFFKKGQIVPQDHFSVSLRAGLCYLGTEKSMQQDRGRP